MDQVGATGTMRKVPRTTEWSSISGSIRLLVSRLLVILVRSLRGTF